MVVCLYLNAYGKYLYLTDTAFILHPASKIAPASAATTFLWPVYNGTISSSTRSAEGLAVMSVLDISEIRGLIEFKEGGMEVCDAKLTVPCDLLHLAVYCTLQFTVPCFKQAVEQ